MIDKDEIVKLAREAGFNCEDHYAIAGMLMHFATLVAAAEREECAKVCDATQRYCSTTAVRSMLMEAATAIRARTKK